MPSTQISIAALSFSLPADGGAVQLFPAGTFDAPRGALKGKGPWKLTAESARGLIERAAARVNDILVDYEHQSLLSSQNGKPVPAAGWIKAASLSFDANKGLFAAAEWCEAAASHIAAKEYKYISPFFTYDGKTGEVYDLINVALTNSPAIDGMSAVSLAAAMAPGHLPHFLHPWRSAASAFLTHTENPMDLDELLERLRYVFNLPTLTTIEDIIAELDKAKALVAGADAAAASLLGLISEKDARIAALSEAAPNPDLYAPVAALAAMQDENNALKTELSALQAERTGAAVSAMVEEALADGRLLPGLKEWALDLGKSNFAALSELVEKNKPLAALAGMQTQGAAPEGDQLPGDAGSIAAAANKYIAEQAALGINVTASQAVNHITNGA